MPGEARRFKARHLFNARRQTNGLRHKDKDGNPVVYEVLACDIRERREIKINGRWHPIEDVEEIC